MIASTTPGGLRSVLASDEPYALLDVREPPEADAGHLPTSTNLPLGDVELRADTLLPDAGTRIVLVDDGDDDGRAGVVAAMLERLGYLDVAVLAGGLEAWQHAGGLLERGRNVPSKRFGEQVLEEAGELLIDPDELAARLTGSGAPLVLDVRTPAEHDREHIPTARNTPGFDVLAAAQAAAAEGRDVVVHCTGRTRGIIAARTLRLAGIVGARALHDGTMGWLLAGHEVERGATPSTPRSRPLDPAALGRLRTLASQAGVTFLDAATAIARLAVADDTCRYAFDLRPPDEGPGSASGFVRAPSGQLVQQLDEWVAVQGVGVVLACDGTERSLVAAYWLARLGVPQVAVVEGGLGAWRERGGPWVSEPPMPTALVAARGEVSRLDPAAARALIDDGAEIWSVAPSPEHRVAHLAGARWVARRRLELDRPGDPHGGPVLLTCTDGARSTLAAAAMRRLGHERFAVLEGGIRAWTEAGGTTVAGSDGLPDDPDDVWRHPLDRGDAAMRDYLSWEIELTQDDPGPV